MLNNKVKVSLNPRADSIATVSPCVWYSMHEGSGQYVADKLGNGGDMELAAYATGTPWANAGWITPDGTNHFLKRASDAYLLSLFRMDTSWAQMLICMSLIHDGTCTATEALFSIGSDAGSSGALTIDFNSAMQLEIRLRGVGASTSLSQNFDAAAINAASHRYAFVLELLNNGNNTLDANLYFDGVLKRTKTALNMVANGATSPFGASGIGGGVRMAARSDGGGAQAQLLNANGSNAQIQDFIGMRRATVDTALALAVAGEIHNYPLEFPNALKAA